MTGLWSLRPSSLRIPRSSSVSYFRHTTSPRLGSGGGGLGVPGDSTDGVATACCPSRYKNGRSQRKTGGPDDGAEFGAGTSSVGLSSPAAGDPDAVPRIPPTLSTGEMVFACRIGTPLAPLPETGTASCDSARARECSPEAFGKESTDRTWVILRNGLPF